MPQRATDDQGRQVIPAQDFVAARGVKSVFGIGGVYPEGHMLVLVVFCEGGIPRSTAELFLPLADFFKAKTASLIESGKVFASLNQIIFHFKDLV
jgi:hypothetical protein